jgi:hypothetical protein
VYTHTLIVLRSCQTYTRYDSARARAVPDGLVFLFDERPLGAAAVAVQNAGARPLSTISDAAALSAADTGWSRWIAGAPSASPPPAAGRSRSLAGFVYSLDLQPGDSTTIVQVISSTTSGDIDRVVGRMPSVWKSEIQRHDSTVRAAAGGARFATGDPWVDRSVSFSKALLSANRHYLDGEVVPMPCPAEYNFMFTHDILLTDLSAIAFDPARVRKDLLYLAAHSRDSVLPHAYYWKDDRFVTEYCAAGNWNHLWWVLAAASYLRHTDDTATVARLMPIVSRSLEMTLTRRRGNVMIGDEPDWWDFGHAEGARAYLTILTVRALEEYLFLGARMGRESSTLLGLERAAEDLRNGLRAELWDDSAGYLFNTTGGLRDNHVYMGPLMAAVFGTLPREDAARLVETAGRILLDPPVGIRTVAPADFHTDSVKAYYNVKGNEGGNPYLYANGGVWYLGNAWYCWALRAAGSLDSAFAFYRRAMTVDGIARSPRGQPALYEYRFADESAPDHGWVDKPTMMWSAAFCIGTAYRMIGCEDSPWNITVGGGMPGSVRSAEADYLFGNMKRVSVSGEGPFVAGVLADGAPVPSRALPRSVLQARTVEVRHGLVGHPYLDRVNASVHEARIDTNAGSLTVWLSSFEGHITTATIISPFELSATINGAPAMVRSETFGGGARSVVLRFRASRGHDSILFRWKKP